jgi:hypothetical protein
MAKNWIDGNIAAWKQACKGKGATQFQEGVMEVVAKDAGGKEIGRFDKRDKEGYSNSFATGCQKAMNAISALAEKSNVKMENADGDIDYATWREQVKAEGMSMRLHKIGKAKGWL